MLTVLCVKWGDKYGPEWVYNLQKMVEDNLTIPHEFICLTDKAIPNVKCVEILTTYKTWWSKLGLFETGRFRGKKIYLDLDVVIKGNIDWLADYGDDKLYARDDFSYSLKKPEFQTPEWREYIGGDGTVNSSVMVWTDDCAKRVWEEFTPDVINRMHGDQNWISYCLFPHDELGFLPDEKISSYKYQVRRGEPVGDIVVFHGNPKVTDLPQDSALVRLWRR